VALAREGRIETAISETRVTFRALSEAECRNYWASGEPVDKAGAYAIQGFGAVFITRLEGSYSGVMGLPLCETAALLDSAGVRRWQARA
jgi:septum formation protein